jgi:hypothetical protein
MGKTHLRQLPGGVESPLPLWVISRHEMAPEIEHHGTRQQQGHKTGEAKRAGKQGFADQQQARAASEEQGNTVGCDSQQNYNRNRINLPVAHQIEDALAHGESRSNEQGRQLGV